MKSDHSKDNYDSLKDNKLLGNKRQFISNEESSDEDLFGDVDANKLEIKNTPLSNNCISSDINKNCISNIRELVLKENNNKEVSLDEPTKRHQRLDIKNSSKNNIRNNDKNENMFKNFNPFTHLKQVLECNKETNNSGESEDQIQDEEDESETQSNDEENKYIPKQYRELERLNHKKEVEEQEEIEKEILHKEKINKEIEEMILKEKEDLNKKTKYDDDLLSVGSNSSHYSIKSDFYKLVSDINNKEITEEYDNLDDYTNWKERETLRIKASIIEKEEREKEKDEIERRRNMTDDQRMEEDLKLGADSTIVPFQRKYVYMQKYYAKPAFFQNIAKEDTEHVYNRDINMATEEDKVNKSLLPKIMQKRRGQFGMKGQTKYTDLVKEDTTEFNPEYKVSENINKKFLEKMGGYKK